MPDVHLAASAPPADEPTNTVLVRQVKTLLARGDSAAAQRLFGTLVERYQRRAARLAYHYLRDPVEVEEAVQDAFLKVFEHLPECRTEWRFDLWFTRIVVNGCLDRLKARTRRQRLLVAASAEGCSLHAGRAADSPSPEGALLARETRRRLLEAVERLPDRQRSAVLLTRFEGHSPREAGAILGLNEATVRVHLFRAVQTLRARLRRPRPAGRGQAESA